MATPFVVGVVALMLERNSTLTVADIVQNLQATAVKDQQTGPADWTPEYGHGKISAKRALDSTDQGATPAEPAVRARRQVAKPRKPAKKKAKAQA